jgi:hypothetical protein
MGYLECCIGIQCCLCELSLKCGNLLVMENLGCDESIVVKDLPWELWDWYGVIGGVVD